MNESNLPNVYVSLEDFTLCVQVRTKSGRLESAQSSLKLIDQVEQNVFFRIINKRSADTAGNIVLGVGFLLNSLFELFTQLFSWTPSVIFFLGGDACGHHRCGGWIVGFPLFEWSGSP